MGGLTGFIITAIILVVLIRKFQASGLILTVFIVIMSALNWQLFAWPLWAAVVVGTGFLWGAMR